MGITISWPEGGATPHQLKTDLALNTTAGTVYAPLTYTGTTPNGTYTLDLGAIQKENRKVNSGVTSYDIPGLKSSERIVLDMKGAVGQLSISGVYKGTAVQASDFYIVMDAVGNIGGLQAMQVSLYTISYTATAFPTYPTAKTSSSSGYAVGTKKTMKGIITDVSLSRDSSTPEADVVYYSFTFHEAAQL